MVPSEENFGSLVDLFSRNGFLEEAKHVLEVMPFAPWPAVWRSILNGCRIHGNRNLGEWASKHLLQLVPKNDAAYVLFCLVLICKEEGLVSKPGFLLCLFIQAIKVQQAISNVRTAVKNKVPLVRSLTLNWVTYCIETSNKAVVLKLHKEYVPICMESVGMRPLERSLEKLDEVRKKKLAEMIGGSGGGLLPSTTTAPVSTSSGSLSGPEVVGSSLVRKSAASMLSGKNPIQAVASKQKSVVSKKGDGGVHSKALGSVKLEDVEPADMSLEEIESRLGSLLKEDTISQLKSTVWKEQLTGSLLEHLWK
ncbi:hypothetical protein IFM89_027680 [Coptis chinensis]|uniref:Pentatricopeptide repeat-containing protein n=1 Tax=Coptis chinensis TaxID=261450 RepID=A0A835J2I1_9MAGN|nr:hypothetical protein IFM89_027680 [Coptis chinensis]